MFMFVKLINSENKERIQNIGVYIYNALKVRNSVLYSKVVCNFILCIIYQHIVLYTFVFKMIGYADKTIKYVCYIIYKDYILTLTNIELIQCEHN